MQDNRYKWMLENNTGRGTTIIVSLKCKSDVYCWLSVGQGYIGQGALTCSCCALNKTYRVHWSCGFSLSLLIQSQRGAVPCLPPASCSQHLLLSLELHKKLTEPIKAHPGATQWDHFVPNDTSMHLHHLHCSHLTLSCGHTYYFFHHSQDVGFWRSRKRIWEWTEMFL